MQPQALADDLAHGHARVQRGIGVLEDHLHAPGVALEIRGPVPLRQGLALEGHRAPGLVVQAQDGLAEGGLARPAFPHQPHDLLLGDGEADIVHRLHPLIAADQEVLGDIACVEDGVHRAASRR